MQNKGKKGGKKHEKRGQININKKDGKNKFKYINEHNKHKWTKLSC